MAETKDQSPNKENKDPIFRKRTFIILAALLAVFFASLVFYDELKIVCRMLIGDIMYKRILSQDFSGLYDIQINLLFTAISTLAIITSFMEQRYLGASYKYWLFKKNPYLLTPQENILLMAVNQIGGLLHVLTDGYRMIAFLSFLISWYLFLYLCYQMYIYLIKVSYMFKKVKNHLSRKYRLKKWDGRCKDIYKKVIRCHYGDKENAYWEEETELIIQVMLMYRDCSPNGEASLIIEKLKQAVIDLVKNEAYVRGGLHEHLKNDGQTLTTKQKESIKEFHRGLVEKIVENRNVLLEQKGHKYTYCEEKTPEENLVQVLGAWFEAIN